ncbi:MAG TPA: YaiO family outer membrane beta-barrel protein [Acidobacteriota bacterium]|nr:YaiO family outer membrane beta-barrel protein [Acidobacteriota bacterium]HNG95565.1 YaiO family outer membrane beta-barrel protein [Acidobacteriota bacterium]
MPVRTTFSTRQAGIWKIVAGLLLALAITFTLSEKGLAQTQSQPKPDQSGTIEVGFDRHWLTDGQEDWAGAYLRAFWASDSKNTWMGEMSHQSQFGDQGTYFAVGNTHAFNDRWYSNVSVGTSAGGFFWPRVRVDAFINRKWGEKKKLVTTIGTGYFDAKSVYHDNSFFAGATYYASPSWIVEGGVRVNVSNPGRIVAQSQFLAVTQGQNKHHYVTARYSFGREAYQLLAPSAPIVDFSSQVMSVTWRQWTSKNWGFKVHVEHYDNPSYRRTGLEMGVFKDF